MKKAGHSVKLCYVLLAIMLSIMISCLPRKVFGDINDFMNLNSSSDCVAPSVILEDGANSTSTVYENKTSAKISINATSTESTYNYSLNVVNNNASPWEVTLECYDCTNISRVNTTIIFHDNSTSSEQITISNGSIIQSSSHYDLASEATVHIGVMNIVEDSSEGTAILHAYLRIRTPNTTTYTLYIITFEFI